MRRPLLTLLVCVCFAAAQPRAEPKLKLRPPSDGARAAEKRFITERDLLKFTWIADPQISPDGSTVAFVRVTVNEKENRYESSLFVVSTNGSTAPRRVTSGIRDTSPRWAPDSRRLAFVRAVEKDGRVQAGQIHLLHMDGGEAQAMTDTANGASAPVWSPDGKTIAFTASTSPQDAQAAQDSRPAGSTAVAQDFSTAEASAKAVSPAKSDVQVITRAVYRANGNPTYVDPTRRTHIWTVDASGAPGAKAKQITDGEFDEQNIVWARGGESIYFTSDRVAESYYLPFDADVYSVPAAGGPITKIASIDGSIGEVSPSPDGKRLAFIGSLHGKPVRSYNQPDLWVTDAAPGSTPKNLTESYDFDMGGGIGGDQAAPRGQNRKPILWSSDGASLVAVSAEHGSGNFKRVTIATGKVEPLTTGAHDVMGYSATPDASTIAATFSTQTNIGDIFVLSAEPKLKLRPTEESPNQITRINEELFKDLQQSDPEEIWYRSFDGKQVQGWILKPPDFDPSKKYPLILEIHGGPHAAYGHTYTHEFQWMAAKGYVVLFTNPRGSTSYGQDFGNIIQFRYPGDDYKDLMLGVDDVLKKGYIDPNRLGVTGGSGGGLLTNWTITQTQRFKAAAAQRDIADWYGFWFTADFTLFQPTWFRKAPWEDPQDFTARSPITHVANVTTPLMLVLGDLDYRTPTGEGGEMMFRALKYRKIPTVMVRFPRETHELSRSGEPRHRIERLQHIIGWMDKWLVGSRQSTVESRSAVVSQQSTVRNDYTKDENWLCRPGRNDACAVDQTTTIVAANGTLTREAFTPNLKAPIDCFYVYPTVSLDPGGNSDMVAGDEERRVVASQLARFASVCRVYAPLYRQATLTALRAATGGKPIPVERGLAYNDVLDAWNTYLQRDNGGRGVVLIGHSQGSGVLTQLIRAEIDAKPNQSRIVSALLLGTNVAVPRGKDVGGAFQSMPLCRSTQQTGCVISYVTFRSTIPPPATSRFGRVQAEGQVAACTNPASLAGGRGELRAYLSAGNRSIVSSAAAPGPWVTPPKTIDTPFVTVPGLLTAECVSNERGSYLEVTVHGNPSDPRTDDIVGDVMREGKPNPDWGLHLIDVSVAMGNLVNIVRDQAKAYLSRVKSH